MIRSREDRWFDRFRQAGDPRWLAKVFDRTAPERIEFEAFDGMRGAADFTVGTTPGAPIEVAVRR